MSSMPKIQRFSSSKARRHHFRDATKMVVEKTSQFEP
jgi:hypothetical protein